MLDWTYIEGVLPTLTSAFFLTLKISAIGIVIALFLGAVCSMILYRRVPALSALVNGYVAFFRNTPLLLHLFFLYYGLPRISPILLSFETTALIGLSLLGGAFMTESFKSGLSAVRPSQIDAAKAIGLSKWQQMRYVIFPQALSYSVPTLGANAIFLFKETSIFTAIAGTDITTVAIGYINMDYKTYEMLFMLVMAYLVVILPFIFLLNFLEKRVRYAEFGN